VSVASRRKGSTKQRTTLAMADETDMEWFMTKRSYGEGTRRRADMILRRESGVEVGVLEGTEEIMTADAATGDDETKDKERDMITVEMAGEVVGMMGIGGDETSRSRCITRR